MNVKKFDVLIEISGKTVLFIIREKEKETLNNLKLLPKSSFSVDMRR